MGKARKPRVTPARLEAAKKFCELSQMCVLIVRAMEDNEIVERVKESQSEIAKGLEYIYDILEWESDKLISKQK